MYDRVTGHLSYEDVGADSWFPLDLLSVSGAFDFGEPLPPVPLVQGNALYDEHFPDVFPPPFWEANAEVNGIVVSGSEAIRLRFDPYFFWPRTANDPVILERWGLNQAPTRYDYGFVLPPGLERDFLVNDLHTSGAAYHELVIVPEPRSMAMVLLMATNLLRGPTARRSLTAEHP